MSLLRTNHKGREAVNAGSEKCKKEGLNVSTDSFPRLPRAPIPWYFGPIDIDTSADSLGCSYDTSGTFSTPSLRRDTSSTLVPLGWHLFGHHSPL